MELIEEGLDGACQYFEKTGDAGDRLFGLHKLEQKMEAAIEEIS
jgi:hypothetical protein